MVKRHRHVITIKHTVIHLLEDLYFREHQAIGKTPAKVAGIDLKLGHDKWSGLITRAYKHKQSEGKIRVWEK